MNAKFKNKLCFYVTLKSTNIITHSNISFVIIPNQGLDEMYDRNVYDIEFVLSKKLSSDDIPASEHIWLGGMNDDLTEIDVLEAYTAKNIVSQKEKEEIIEHNKEVLNNRNNPGDITSNVSFVPIPTDIIIINEKTWALLTNAVELKKYPLLIGPKGVGKTMTCKAIAKALNMDFYKINCGTLFKPSKALIGTIQARDGSTYLIQSEFLRYYSSNKPTLIFLDELNRIPTMAANYMMNILEQEDSYVYSEEEGKKYEKGNNVTFIAACNFGIEYVDTRSLDGAFADRFLKMTIDYLPENEEVELICSRIKNIRKKDVKNLVKKANIIRKQVEEEVFQTGVSTRQLIDMCSFLSKGFSVYDITKYIFRNIFLTANSREEIEIFDKIINSE